MLNWQEFVRRRLFGLALDSTERDEIHAELAAHLEESYEVFCAEGLSQQESLERTLSAAGDWGDLQRKIVIARRRERPMQKRVRQLWAPGLLTMMLSTIFLIVMRRLGFEPRLVGGGILFYAPWLVSLLFFGALGAYLSSRGGALLGTALVASVFPALGLTAVFVLMFPIDFVVARIIGRPVDFGKVATELLRDGVDWILVPGAALLAGGFLMHFLFKRQPWSKAERSLG